MEQTRRETGRTIVGRRSQATDELVEREIRQQVGPMGSAESGDVSGSMYEGVGSLADEDSEVTSAGRQTSLILDNALLLRGRASRNRREGGVEAGLRPKSCELKLWIFLCLETCERALRTQSKRALLTVTRSRCHLAAQL